MMVLFNLIVEPIHNVTVTKLCVFPTPDKSSIHGHVISRSLTQTDSLLEATDDFDVSLINQVLF